MTCEQFAAIRKRQPSECSMAEQAAFVRHAKDCPPCKDSVYSGAILAHIVDPEHSESEFAKGVKAGQALEEALAHDKELRETIYGENK